MEDRERFQEETRLAIIEARRKEPHEALRHIRAARRLLPDEPGLAVAAGESYEAIGDYAQARREYEIAIALDPGLETAHARLHALDEAEDVARLIATAILADHEPLWHEVKSGPSDAVAEPASPSTAGEPVTPSPVRPSAGVGDEIGRSPGPDPEPDRFPPESIVLGRASVADEHLLVLEAETHEPGVREVPGETSVDLAEIVHQARDEAFAALGTQHD